MVRYPADRPADGGLAITRPDGPRLRHHDGHSLRHEITRVADVVKTSTGKDGEEVVTPVHPPA